LIVWWRGGGEEERMIEGGLCLVCLFVGGVGVGVGVGVDVGGVDVDVATSEGTNPGVENEVFEI
jgi:hypothetical protein